MCERVNIMNNGSKMKQTNLSDDDILKGIKKRLDRSDYRTDLDQQVRNLSVDVLAEQARRRRRRRGIQAGSLALASAAAVTLFFVLSPQMQSPSQVAQPSATTPQAVAMVTTDALASDVVDDMIDEAAISLLAESTDLDQDPLIISESDLDILLAEL